MLENAEPIWFGGCNACLGGAHRAVEPYDMRHHMRMRDGGAARRDTAVQGGAATEGLYVLEQEHEPECEPVTMPFRAWRHPYYYSIRSRMPDGMVAARHRQDGVPSGSGRLGELV